jgi:tetratricopeptide (TPR) repeat protein
MTNKVRKICQIVKVGMVAFAASANAATLSGPELLNLERRVWDALPSQLGFLEIEVAKLIQNNPHSVFGHYLLAQLYLRIFADEPSDLLLLKQASDLAQQAVEIGPKSEYGYVALANVLDFMGHSQKGVEVLTSAETRGVKRSWRTWFTLARLQADTQSNEQILGHLTKAMEGCHKQVAIVAPYVVATLQTVSEGDEYIARLKDWSSQCESPYYQLTLADAYSQNKDYRSALRIYEKVVEQDTSLSSAGINAAMIQYRHLNDFSGAEKRLRSLLSSNEFQDPSQAVLARTHLANALVLQSKYDEANGLFVEALASTTDPTAIIEAAANAYRKKSEFKKLVALLDTVVNEIGGSGLALALRGEVLSEHLADHQKAIRSFSDAILLQPERGDYYNGMGLALYRANDLESALKLFQASLGIDSNDAIARYNEACMLVRLGKTKEGLASLQIAVGNDENLRTSAAKDSDFAAVRNEPQFQEIISRPGFAEPSITPDVEDNSELLGH